MTEYIAENYALIYAIDISGEMIKQGKERLKQIKNIAWYETDGKRFPMFDDLVNVAFSYLVFQHFKDRKMVEANFKEVYRVLKPKGLFKVRMRSDKVDKDRWWGGVEYTEQSIGKLIKEVGFKLLKTETVSNYGFWLWLEK